MSGRKETKLLHMLGMGVSLFLIAFHHLMKRRSRCNLLVQYHILGIYIITHIISSVWHMCARVLIRRQLILFQQ